MSTATERPTTPPPPERWRLVNFRGRVRRPKARLTTQLAASGRVCPGVLTAPAVYDPPPPPDLVRRLEAEQRRDAESVSPENPDPKGPQP